MLDLLSISSHQRLFSADITHKYWAVNIHPNDYHYFVFCVPKIE